MSFITGFIKMARSSFPSSTSYFSTPIRSMAGSTENARKAYNKKVLDKMMTEHGSKAAPRLPARHSVRADIRLKGLDPSHPDYMMYQLKTASGNLPMDALELSNVSMADAVPGTSLRDKAETGQGRQKNVRTENVQNEDREFKSSLKTKAQTARGGRHYGGSIREGF